MCLGLSRSHTKATSDARELRALNVHMAQAEKLASLGQIAAGVVHELNNPLTSIVAYTDWLVRKQGPTGDADSLEVRLVAAGAAEETRRLAELVGETLGRSVAVSRPFSSAADRPAAEADARATLEAALALDRPPAIAQADRLPMYRMLGVVSELSGDKAMAAVSSQFTHSRLHRPGDSPAL